MTSSDTELRGIVQAAFLRRPLAELLDACGAAALDLIVLKGAALAETVYPRPSLRPFGDIDVLIRLEDASRVFALLSKLGYVVEAAAWKDLVSGRGCEANFFRSTERGVVVIEVHTDLLNNALFQGLVSLDHAGLWQRSRPACLAGTGGWVLGPEDQLLHLCLHLACHYFAAPNSLEDIVQICIVQSVDWPLFLTLCRKANAVTIGYCGLFAALTRGGASVPPFVLESLAPRSHRRTLENLVTPRSGEVQSNSCRFLLVWLLLDSAHSRFGAFHRLLFPSRAWLHSHYHHDFTDAPYYCCLPPGALLYARHMQFLLRVCLNTANAGRKCRL
ncbi:MAG: nucleotidyltransferase family protein [Janthinobacterium lividum]